jgi:preprotein translocase subunit SecE
MNSSSKNNAVHHTQKIKARMRQLIEHLREDVGKVTEPKAQALFETFAVVLTGLVKAFNDYEKKSEAAWRTESTASRSKERTTHASRR